MLTRRRPDIFVKIGISLQRRENISLYIAHGDGRESVSLKELTRQFRDFLGFDSVDPRHGLIERYISANQKLVFGYTVHPAGGVLQTQHEMPLELLLVAAEIGLGKRL
jgi:hypothetical protein